MKTSSFLKIKTYASGLILLAILLYSCSGNKNPMPRVSEVAGLFQDPPAKYGPSPLWGWQGPVDEEVIRNDLNIMHELNFRSVNIEAGSRMAQTYLSDGWFDLVRFAVEQARERDMNVWLIDEGKYPSGFAGGLINREWPEYMMQGLDTYERIRASGGEHVLRNHLPLQVFSAVAQNSEDRSLIVLDLSTGVLDWTPPEGEWLITLVYRTYRTSATRAARHPSGGKDGVNSLIDYLNPDATRKWMEYTHEGYKKHMGDEFGKTFLGFRGDEPDYGFIPWSSLLPFRFIEEKGYDVRPYLAAFSLQHQDDELIRIKADFWDVWSEMFAENYFKVQADWCEENGLESMNHLNNDNNMMRLVRSSGCIFRTMRHMHIPGIDAIWDQIWPGRVSDFPKYASSISNVYGKPRTISETFAAYNTVPNIEQAKWVIDHQFVRGINLWEWMFWSSSATRLAGPSGWMSRAGEGFPDLVNYTRRLSYLLSVSKPAANIAVYYPMSSLWLADTIAHMAELQLTRLLLENQRDFDFIDEYALNHVLEIKNGGLRNLSGQVYKTVLIPSASAISADALNRLEAFAKSGGKVVFLERKPTLLIESNFRDAGGLPGLEWAIYDPDIILGVPGVFPYTNKGYVLEERTEPVMDESKIRLTSTVLAALPEPALKLELPSPHLKYIHKKLKDSDIFLIFNEGEEKINMDVTFAAVGKVHIWDAYTGEIIESPNVSETASHTRMSIEMDGWESKIITIGNNLKAAIYVK
jgi:hypothetical protein